MSGRGGFGGGRGGRGGGAGGRLATAPMGATTFGDIQQVSKHQQARFPETEASAHPEPISEPERRSSSKQLKLLDYNRTSAFWPTLNSNATGSVNNKKSELISYSTQFDTLEKEKPSLKNLNLQKDVFPKEIWNSFMQGENRRERIKNRNQLLKDRKLGKKSEINWNDFDDKEKEGADPDETAADLDDEEAELGDYEDEEDDDYAENYFDNGEDDGMDGGGSDGGGEAAYD